jgi:uncharacterized protein YdaU (DUF1376 family)
MAQHREPPAFQEYAAAMMAKTEYRLMSLAGRGLLYTMRLECWVNRRLPPDAPRLARVLGFDVAEVAALIPEVQPFFAIDQGGLYCPELEDYREHVDDRRHKQSEGGKQTAAKHKAKRQQGDPEQVAGDLPSDLQGTCSSLVQHSPAKPKPIQVLREAPISDEWVSDYDRASNGF